MCISAIRTDECTPQKVPSVIAELSKTCAAASRSMRKHLVVQHNYHDHARDPEPSGPQHVLDDSTAMNHNAFPLKLYEMLTLVDRDGYSDVISWQPHGRCFVVHKPDEFKAILPRYFKLSKVASFQRQLNLYGFMRLTRGMDKGGYYHELFLEGRSWLAQKIQRVKVKGTGVRAKSNPEQEPDFWNMPWVNKQRPGQVPEGIQSTSDASPVPSHKQQQQDHDDCTTTSVVSQDEEPRKLPQYKHVPPKPEVVSLSQLYSSNIKKKEALMDDTTRVESWGMPFYYLSSPPTPYHAIPKHIEDDLDCIVNDMDLDETVQDLLDHSKEQSFADMLERVVQ